MTLLSASLVRICSRLLLYLQRLSFSCLWAFGCPNIWFNHRAFDCRFYSWTFDFLRVTRNSRMALRKFLFLARSRCFMDFFTLPSRSRRLPFSDLIPFIMRRSCSRLPSWFYFGLLKKFELLTHFSYGVIFDFDLLLKLLVLGQDFIIF